MLRSNFTFSAFSELDPYHRGFALPVNLWEPGVQPLFRPSRGVKIHL
jgi:hypothetical protein